VNFDRLGFVLKVFGELLGGEARRAIGGHRTPAGDASGQDLLKKDLDRARAMRLALELLGPFYIKVGQLLSTRPDFVPPLMIEEFKKLHDNVTIMPFSEIEAVLEEELGVDWKRTFMDIDSETPLGTASLAQVYAVTMWDGSSAVVKIQRPGVREIVLADMVILRRVARIIARAAPRFNAVIDVEAMLRVLFDAMESEYDFTVEAKNMERGRATVKRYRYLSVPEVLLATKRVLVMTRAPGVSIRDVDHALLTAEERAGIGRELLGYIYRGFFVENFFHADPHPGNIFVQPGEQASLIDWGMVGRIDRRTATLVLLALMSLGENDGQGLAKAWIEMGRATEWADIVGFTNDMAELVPKISSASLADLDFGVTLFAILEHATKRGIQTSPTIALLGKAFANIEGAIRYLAPELSLMEVFEDEMRGIMIDLARPLLSQAHAARTALELMIGATTITDQLRTMLRDISNGEFTVRVGNNIPLKRMENPRVLLGLGALALWLDHRRRRRR
jgi:ubiquinone biosynthesis protein